MNFCLVFGATSNANLQIYFVRIMYVVSYINIFELNIVCICMIFATCTNYTLHSGIPFAESSEFFGSPQVFIVKGLSRDNRDM